MNRTPCTPVHARESERGFTLVELAVVLAIVGLLLGGMITALSVQTELEASRETRRLLQDVRDAIIGYAIVNGRLPCPASGSVATGQANAGMEAVTSGACTAEGGVLPWATLQVPETDGWGRRFTYRVTSVFGRSLPQSSGFNCSTSSPNPNPNPPSPPTQAVFALCSPGNITVRTSTGVDVATGLPAMVVSHGKNGYGAYLPSGTLITTTLAAADEVENADNDGIFILADQSPAYDDLLNWVPISILVSRMLTAAKLP